MPAQRAAERAFAKNGEKPVRAFIRMLAMT
jgi:hypothetical protein